MQNHRAIRRTNQRRSTKSMCAEQRRKMTMQNGEERKSPLAHDIATEKGTSTVAHSRKGKHPSMRIEKEWEEERPIGIKNGEGKLSRDRERRSTRWLCRGEKENPSRERERNIYPPREKERENVDAIEKVRNRWVESASRWRSAKKGWRRGRGGGGGRQ